jgi:hypothetical protein
MFLRDKNFTAFLKKESPQFLLFFIRVFFFSFFVINGCVIVIYLTYAESEISCVSTLFAARPQGVLH